ncbi:MAG: RnfABCDGE type electron transport complex subunit B [Dokdonella sp.]
MQEDLLSARVDALLPQTQCTRCGYPTCRAYAEAIANNSADIDRCPPGGAEGVAALARLLGRETKPLNPEYGNEAPPLVAFIDEDVCIGCTKCIQACPVDAIVGAAKKMHTIIAAECTGCELCLPPCPVDCIALLPIAPAPLARAQVLARAADARARFDARNARLARTTTTAAARVGAASAAMLSRYSAEGIAAEAAPTKVATSEAMAPITRDAVLEAIARGKARRVRDAKDPPTQ